ncbi:glycogen debranching protein GlgX [Nocardioides sp.]|uniref:glycogen debranching protein GlgX n=1 Tax=Nocardioides sp. TaxID=35761 RepID=UPI00260A30DA|nr:glycogen debranching protein GlgX [Nocardioides sp.]
MPAPSAPPPLGVHLTPTGASVAVLAMHAEAVEVCLFTDGEERRLPLTGRTHGVWHGHLDGVTHGQRYGLRAHGPWEPARGHRYNPAKLLLDPYARAIDGHISWGPAVFAHEVDGETWLPLDGRAFEGGAAIPNDEDSAADVPHGVVVAPPQADLSLQPKVSWPETVIYEAHVRGLTMRHPKVPADERGTYAALGHPAVVEHLTRLGVTTLELLPIHAIGDEPALVRRGLRNYWGYSTLSFFAPEPRYATAAARKAGPDAVIVELAQAIRTLHEAGIEVVLDVVYNHTAEGGVEGPMFSLRGLDAATYYRLDSRGRDLDVTGTGGTLDFRNAWTVRLALDSLRYWVTAFGVDGFWFDLATTPARGTAGFEPDHPFLVALRTDPVLSRVKLIAEPWDVGHHGWRTGQFPAPFSEWNDRFRDDVRTFWLADAAETRRHEGVLGHGVRHLATRLAGSADFFSWSASLDAAPRTPTASVNFVTAHDGFTLADLTAYERTQTEATGDGGAAGADDNRAWNHGVEGETNDAHVLSARRRSMRALLGTLLLATGVPMITAGDELGRTQHGNNNAYCLDDETSWLDWGDDRPDQPEQLERWRQDLLATTAALLRWRRELTALRQDRFFAGRAVHTDGTTDLGWFAADGTLMDHDRWHDASLRTLQMFLYDPTPRGSVLIVLHAGDEPVPLTLPPTPWARSFHLLWDSAFEHPDDVPHVTTPAGGGVVVAERSVRLYRALR